MVPSPAARRSAPGWGQAITALLPDGRLHLQHGPIDLVIGIEGDAGEAEHARRQAIARFADVLETLVAELPLLRTPLGTDPPPLAGPVACRMLAACWPHRAVYITPMAAVAGAVADEVLAALVAGRTLRRVHVNNGGDIALWLAEGERFRIGLAGIEDARLHGELDLCHTDPWRGVATSGWRGRSQSLGIADAVTVVARDAATADAAATLLANAVNVDHPGIVRRPARELRDDSDLGLLPVTVEVPPLPAAAIDAALESGSTQARRMQALGLIGPACLRLQGRVVVIAPGTPRYPARTRAPAEGHGFSRSEDENNQSNH
jgi:ApbE superfamily uncharacterized protein (UPF0280 family)